MSGPGVSALLLAAGESKRMGRLKPLLPFGDLTVIETILRTLGQCPLAEIIVVLGHRAGEIEPLLKNYPVQIVHNTRYLRGMLSSIQAGLKAAAGDAQAYLICLGDQPRLQIRTVQLLLGAFAAEPGGIYLPCYLGQGGHPLLLDTRYRDEVRALDPVIGLRQLLRRHPDQVRHVGVAAPEVLEDLDTPEEYRLALGHSIR
ncbi:MAG TPA: nucleotidyltransferase family protein [Candidatus Fraserbacteria bacterium]|nr:nucleotidyltransferase family protein [Candidatus Fraserbacteria bacterium]